ncbi:hypothetical protein LTR17_001165 [Elasticomyces elasticus]|nr:hypothetical protein LTR17_001165 [Elasticomyces elasticus]
MADWIGTAKQRRGRSATANANQSLKPASTATNKRKNRDDEVEVLDARPANFGKKRAKGIRAGYTKVHIKECRVCDEWKDTDLFPATMHGTTSTKARAVRDMIAHTSDVCSACWREHIRVALDDPTRTSIACQECNNELTDSDVQSLAVREEYDQYNDKLNLAFIKQDPDYRECSSVDCSYGYIMPKGEGNIFTCRLCESQYCVDCEVPMHSGMTCAQYKSDLVLKAQQERDEKNGTAASEKRVRDTTKPCPNCTRPIEKRDGCDHMRCLKCKHAFCWLCAAPYAGSEGIFAMGNDTHKRTCPYHSASLPKAQPIVG